MKNLVVWGLILLFSASIEPQPAIAGDYVDHDDSKASVTDKYHQEIERDNLKALDVETTNGSVTISGYEGAMIVVDAAIEVRGPKEEVCQELLKDLKVQVDTDNRTLKIDVKEKKKKNYSTSVSFTVKVPADLSVDASSVNGSVTVTSIKGDLDLSTVNGSINASSSEGAISISTINGSINVADFTGDLECSTINGAISCTAGKSAPENVELSTINGNIRMTLMTIPNATLDAGSLSGRISLSGLNIALPDKIPRHLEVRLGDAKGDYELSTVNGSIDISVNTPE